MLFDEKKVQTVIFLMLQKKIPELDNWNLYPI